MRHLRTVSFLADLRFALGTFRRQFRLSTAAEAVILIVAVAASLIPAGRAAAVEPSEALRS